jgi:hypothetical protein
VTHSPTLMLMMNVINLTGSVRTEFKNRRFLEFKFNFFEKIKNMEKNLCKKTRSNSKNIGGEIFSNINGFVGFKLNQKCKNGPTWPTTHVYTILSPRVSKTEVATFPISSD